MESSAKFEALPALASREGINRGDFWMSPREGTAMFLGAKM
jgi:hypothetical protein